eukprot:3727057-Pleurochrysis_carterae.AAC.3
MLSCVQSWFSRRVSGACRICGHQGKQNAKLGKRRASAEAKLSRKSGMRIERKANCSIVDAMASVDPSAPHPIRDSRWRERASAVPRSARGVRPPAL